MAPIPEVKPTDVSNNSQTVKIQPQDLERAARRGKRFDSTLADRERNYESRRPSTRFDEYR